MSTLAVKPPLPSLARTRKNPSPLTLSLKVADEKQPRYPSTDDQTDNVVHTKTGISYRSGINMNETLSFVTKWMQLKAIILTKTSHTQKDKYVSD